MKALTALLIHEMRSHLPFYAVFGISIQFPFFAHRFVTGGWDYWSSDWSVAGLIACSWYLAPALLMLLALQLWAGERERGTVAWLYARPIAATSLFSVRVLALLTTWVLWSTAAAVVHLPSQSARAALAGNQLFVPANPIVVWAVSGLLVIAVAALGGTLSRSPVHALGGIVGSSTAAIGLIALAAWRVPTVPILSTWGREWLVNICLAAATWTALGCLVAAWAVGRRAPLDQRRNRRALKTAFAFAVPGMIACLYFLLLPLHANRLAVHQVELLSSGSQIRLCAAAGFDRPGVGIPVLIDTAGKGEEISAATTRLWVSRQQELVVFNALSHKGTEWTIINGSGKKLDWLKGTDTTRWQGLGWSPGGEKFAWISRGELHLLGAGGILASYSQPLESDRLAGGWIDDDNVILTGRSSQEQVGSWTIVTRAGTTTRAPESYIAGSLRFPSLASRSPQTAVGESRIRSELVAWRSDHAGQWTLLRAEPADWILRPVLTRAKPIVVSIGAGPEESLVWLERIDSEPCEFAVLRLRDGNNEPDRIACLEPSDYNGDCYIPVYEYLGFSHDWIVWAGRHDVVAVSVETGETVSLGPHSGLGPNAVVLNDHQIIMPGGTKTLPSATAATEQVRSNSAAGSGPRILAGSHELSPVIVSLGTMKHVHGHKNDENPEVIVDRTKKSVVLIQVSPGWQENHEKENRGYEKGTEAETEETRTPQGLHSQADRFRAAASRWWRYPHHQLLHQCDVRRLRVDEHHVQLVTNLWGPWTQGPLLPINLHPHGGDVFESFLLEHRLPRRTGK